MGWEWRSISPLQEVDLGAEGLVPFEVHAGRGGVIVAGEEVEPGPVASLIPIKRGAGDCVV